MRNTLKTTLGMRRLLFSTLILALSTPVYGSYQGYEAVASDSTYPGGVTTGGAFADIDGDGSLDFVVANGNDILRQRVEVYLNDGAGDYPFTPQWSSADVDYHGHLAVGDVDQDGWQDVVVSVFLGPGGFGDEGRVKLYRNLGGTLESTPSWSSSDTFFSFSCDLGDADGDGDLDLAVATGEPYFDPPDTNRLYTNTGGAFGGLPSWEPSASDHALDVAFGDADGDGDLDLAFATSLSPTTVFLQGPGGFATTPGWTATDNSSPFGNTIVWKDIDGDGFQELALSDNSQLSNGSGDFKIYDNVGGSLTTTPIWSDFGGFVSAIAFADLDRNGRPDLFGGIWFGGSQAYLFDGGPYPTAPDWEGAGSGTVEAFAFGDVDEAGLFTVSNETHAGGKRIVYLANTPVREVLAVRVDGTPLAISEFSYDREDGWLALDRTPAVDVSCDYVSSDSLDLGITHWDQSVGNEIFLREPVPRASFRNDAGGLNATDYVATPPRLGTQWTASIDNTGSGNTLAAILGYATPAEFAIPIGIVLINVGDPQGELLNLVGSGSGSVAFSLAVPLDTSLAGLSLATQGVGFGGGAGFRLLNAYDLQAGI